jgi:hypothetical protein
VNDNGDTVERVNAKLLRMEQNWAESRLSPFPKSIWSTMADLRLAVERHEAEAAWDAAVQVCAVHAAKMEEQRQEEESQYERKENEFMVVRTTTQLAGGDNAIHCMSMEFDWAMDVDVFVNLSSVGPDSAVPDTSVNLNPTELNDPTLIVLIDTVTIPVPAASVELSPIAAVLLNSTVDMFGTVPEITINGITHNNLTLSAPATSIMSTLPISPRDFSSLRSDMGNLWGSIHHHRYRSHPVHRNSVPDTHRYSHPGAVHSRHSISPPPLPFNSQPCSYFRAKPPVQNVQIIQHP